MVAVLIVSLALTTAETESFFDHLVRMFGFRLPLTKHLQGIWQYWSYAYRLPIIALYFALSISFAVWPAQKNMATLISGTAALMVAAQFWHANGGGVYIAWYLPLLLLIVFRPNLEDRIAMAVVGDGW